MRMKALCTSLWSGVHSARPLIPCVERSWWGARIRPLPPNVTSWTAQEASDSVTPIGGGRGISGRAEAGAGTGEGGRT
jgi:hypothetical protein